MLHVAYSGPVGCVPVLYFFYWNIWIKPCDTVLLFQINWVKATYIFGSSVEQKSHCLFSSRQDNFLSMNHFLRIYLIIWITWSSNFPNIGLWYPPSNNPRIAVNSGCRTGFFDRFELVAVWILDHFHPVAYPWLVRIHIFDIYCGVIDYRE